MLKEYIFNDKFQINIIENKISVLNYDEIVIFDDEKIVLKYINGILNIKGSGLIISKLLSDELLVQGTITDIEFR